jgi:hypothetical protein
MWDGRISEGHLRLKADISRHSFQGVSECEIPTATSGSSLHHWPLAGPRQLESNWLQKVTWMIGITEMWLTFVHSQGLIGGAETATAITVFIAWHVPQTIASTIDRLLGRY